MKKYNICILGAGGKLATEVVSVLSEQGHDVIGFSSSNKSYVYLDILDNNFEHVTDILDEADIIINFIGGTKNAKDLLDINYTCVRRLCSKLKFKGVWFQVSSFGVFDQRLDRIDSSSLKFPRNDYERAKNDLDVFLSGSKFKTIFFYPAVILYPDSYIQRKLRNISKSLLMSHLLDPTARLPVVRCSFCVNKIVEMINVMGDRNIRDEHVILNESLQIGALIKEFDPRWSFVGRGMGEMFRFLKKFIPLNGGKVEQRLMFLYGFK